MNDIDINIWPRRWIWIITFTSEIDFGGQNYIKKWYHFTFEVYCFKSCISPCFPYADYMLISNYAHKTVSQGCQRGNQTQFPSIHQSIDRPSIKPPPPPIFFPGPHSGAWTMEEYDVHSHLAVKSNQIFSNDSNCISRGGRANSKSSSEYEAM